MMTACRAMLATVVAFMAVSVPIGAGLARMSRGGAAGRTRGHRAGRCERAEKISARAVVVGNLS